MYQHGCASLTVTQDLKLGTVGLVNDMPYQPEEYEDSDTGRRHTLTQDHRFWYPFVAFL